MCMEVDPFKVKRLKTGIFPIWEPSLAALVERNRIEGHLNFTTDAANAMLVTKIRLMNEMTNLAKGLGADIEEVRKCIGVFPRIVYHLIYHGCAYGGSCFPKDVKALLHTVLQLGYNTQLLQAVWAINNTHKRTFFSKLVELFGGKTIAVWGPVFKLNSEEKRKAPSRALMEALWKSRFIVQMYCPQVTKETERIYSNRAGLTPCGDQYAALQGADNTLAICTEWQQFRVPKFAVHARRHFSKVRHAKLVSARQASGVRGVLLFYRASDCLKPTSIRRCDMRLSAQRRLGQASTRRVNDSVTEAMLCCLGLNEKSEKVIP